MNKYKTMRETGISLIILIVLLESALRLFPGLIPFPILAGFDENLRQHIAEKRGLQTGDSLQVLTRDNGLSIQTFKPHAKIHMPLRDFGAVNPLIMDERGFCNLQNTFSKDIQILAVGDSFTWCTNVLPKDTWSAHLANLSGYATYNMGHPGTGPYEYVKFAEYFADEFPNLRAVIFAIYEGNDLRGAYAERNKKKNPGEIKKEARSCALPRFICPIYGKIKESILGRKSYIFNLAIASARNVKNRLVSTSNAHDFMYTIQGLDNAPISFNTENTDQDEVEYAEKIKKEEINFDVFSDALEQFKNLARIRGFTPYILYIPSAHTAYSDYVTFSDVEIGNLLSEFSKSQRAFLAQKSQELDVKFLDETEYVQKHAKTFRTQKTLLYYPTNLHLTKQGHQVIAQFLSGVILFPSSKF